MMKKVTVNNFFHVHQRSRKEYILSLVLVLQLSMINQTPEGVSSVTGNFPKYYNKTARSKKKRKKKKTHCMLIHVCQCPHIIKL